MTIVCKPCRPDVSDDEWALVAPYMLLPHCWVVGRSFAWLARCRRLSRNHERLPETVAGLHLVAFAILLLHHVTTLVSAHNSL